MKTKISLLVLTVLLTAPCPAQKYHDALLNELKGPVKLLIDEEGFLYEYDNNGVLVAHYYDNGKKTEYGIQCERDAQGYVTQLHMFHDKACTDFFYTTLYQYNDKRQIVSYTELESNTTETRTVYYTYDSNGNIIQRKIYIDGELAGTIEYEYENFDEWGNWLARSSHYDIDDSFEDELRFISYWQMPTPASVPEPAPATAPAETISPTAETGWQSLIGKRLLLTTYGPSRNGQEINQFLCTSGEYIKLDSNNRLYWNNRIGGDIIFHYLIDGNRLDLIQLTGKGETDDKWIELTRQGSNFIKTESNLGIYRYFSIEE